MRIVLAQINPILADLEGNEKKILQSIEGAKRSGASLILFPELAMVGYFPDDLLLDGVLIAEVEKRLQRIAERTEGLMAIVGLPRRSGAGAEKPLYNSAALLADGKVLGYQDKRLLPTYDVFDERRYFEPGKESPIWEYRGYRIGVTICEDLWQHGRGVAETSYSVDPLLAFPKGSIDLLVNISGSPYSFRRKERRVELFQQVAKDLSVPLLFCNQVGANDQLIFDGYSFVMNEKGERVLQGRGFVEEELCFDSKTSLCAITPPDDDGIADLYAALVLGVRDYFRKQGFSKAVLGLSGGIDSALVACIACDALGNEQVMALNLPSRYNAKEGIEDAKQQGERLGIPLSTIAIDSTLEHYLQLLSPLFQKAPSDVTAQNLQARIRGMLLMAFANQHGALLLNTGNKSEMAMGYATLYGDMAGGLAVLQDVTKEKIYRLAAYVRSRDPSLIPESVIHRMPSAELKENQVDVQELPPYTLLDQLLEAYLERGDALEQIAEELHIPLSSAQEIVARVHRNEYKRRQAPMGLRVTLKAFDRGRYVPIVQKWR
ncbi:MAG: NAD+ synthase [Verrucomicrobiota bacterium]|nr:NAD+ synthase [Verrucomicrobiota bacterium]